MRARELRTRSRSGPSSVRWAALVAPVLSGACAGSPDSGEQRNDGAIATAEQAEVCTTFQNVGNAATVDDAPVAADPSDPTKSTTTYGLVQQMDVGYAGTATWRVLLRFNVFGIPPGSSVTSATLTLRVLQSPGKERVYFNAMTAPWSESTVTWNTVASAPNGGFGGIVATLSTMGLPNNSNATLTLPPALVQTWLDPLTNHGLLLEHPAAGRTVIASSEPSSVAIRPKLHVCYEPPSCNDGVQNQGELGMDCGGSCPPCCSPEVCNGQDDDCDGSIDEDNPGGGGACTTGALGACSAGVITCVAGTLACAPLFSPVAEICDSLDNDCNGLADDNNPGGGLACSTGLPGTCASGTAQCVLGAQECVSSVVSVEICDGLDNDCDGLVDDGVNCPTFLGPTPYLSFSDSPFKGLTFESFYLETFEQGAIFVPGVSQVGGTIVASPVPLIDSVDADDGLIDGSGSAGHSLFNGSGAAGVRFTFNSAAFGGKLPTRVGIVWTDGNQGGITSFIVKDAALNAILSAGPFFFGDASFSGGTAEDRFLGAVYAPGIASFTITTTGGGIEVDHLQYGW